MKEKKILFVCKHNRFRSKTAEAYFNKINKNKKVKAKSAGLFKGSPINKKIIFIGKKLGFNITGRPQGMGHLLLSWQNILIVVADNVPKTVFTKHPGKKLIVWEISDVKASNKTGVERTMKCIMRRVDRLVEELNKEK